MRILFLSERYPWPLHDGGNIRTFHLLRALASRHEITLLSHRRPEVGDGEGLSNLCRSVLLDRAPRIVRGLRCLLAPAGTVRSLFISRNWSASLLAAARAELGSGTYELVYCNQLDTACYLPQLGWPCSLFDSHNCLSTLVGAMAKGRPLAKVLSWESRQLAKWEKGVCDRATLTLACSENDAQSFLQLSAGASLKVLPNGVDCAYYHPPGMSMASASKVVFIGAMGYAPNVEAVEWFCEHIWQTVKVVVPSAVFQIIGKGPSARVARLGKAYPDVQIVGQVEDVRPYLWGAAAAVVPLLRGGGTRLKIMEAMAAGCPVVTTSKGVEGIPALDGRDLIVRDQPQEFVAAIAELISNRDLRRQIAGQALKFAKQFDWSYISAQLLTAAESYQTPSFRGLDPTAGSATGSLG